MALRILVVDDEKELREMLKEFLVKEGYEVKLARNGKEALEWLVGNERFDLILLDIMMPEMNGVETLQQIRKQMNTPVIFLTAKTEEIDKLLGLEMGADDYITKPFSLRELHARMKAVLRRFLPEEEKKTELIIRGHIKIDPEQYLVWVRDELIQLTPTEFKILYALAQKPGRVYSRLQLMNIAMGEAYANYERSIDTHVSNLRKKIEDDPAHPDYILTVYGIGYRFGENL